MAGSFITGDLSAIFASSDFGEAENAVTWKGDPVDGCIFDDEDIKIDLGEGVGEIAHQAMITGPSASFSGIAEDDVIIARGVTYHVKYWMDDGSGVIEIYLERQ